MAGRRSWLIGKGLSGWGWGETELLGGNKDLVKAPSCEAGHCISYEPSHGRVQRILFSISHHF